MLGLRGGSEAWFEVCSQEFAEVRLGGSDSVCKPAAAGLLNADELLLVAHNTLLLILPCLASFRGLVLAGCKSSLLTSNSPKMSPSSSPDRMCMHHWVT